MPDRRAPRSFVVAQVVLLALLVLPASGGVSSARAQEATPAGSALPEGVEFVPLAFGPGGGLPPAPALVALLRLTYEPGAGFAAPILPGPWLGLVETGTLIARPHGLVMYGRGAEIGHGLSQGRTGDVLTLGTGDYIGTLPGTAIAYTNESEVPTTSLVLRVLSTGSPLPTVLPAGVTAQLLVTGVAESWPDQPVLELARFTLAPGAALPPGRNDFGPTMLFLEDGIVTYVMEIGEVQVLQVGTAGSPVASPAARPGGGEELLEEGDAVFEQLGVVSGLHNRGTEPATGIYAAVIAATS